MSFLITLLLKRNRWPFLASCEFDRLADITQTHFMYCWCLFMTDFSYTYLLPFKWINYRNVLTLTRPQGVCCVIYLRINTSYFLRFFLLHPQAEVWWHFLLKVTHAKSKRRNCVSLTLEEFPFLILNLKRFNPTASRGCRNCMMTLFYNISWHGRETNNEIDDDNFPAILRHSIHHQVI